MKKEYFEDLADYILRHGMPAKAFDSPSDISREDIIKRLETDKKYRKKHEERKKNMENLKCYFGKK